MKILLADDSMTAQNMGKKILTDAGFEVIAVSNGAAALKKITSDNPDIIILDVFMPGYTGLEVCERVKNNPETARKPVLLTVGKMEPFNPDDSNRVHAEGVMIKPFEATDLTAAIEAITKRFNIQPAAIPLHPEEPPNTPHHYKSYEETVRLTEHELHTQLGIVDTDTPDAASGAGAAAAVAVAHESIEARDPALELEQSAQPELQTRTPFSQANLAPAVVEQPTAPVTATDAPAWDPVLDGISIPSSVITAVPETEAAPVPEAQPAFGMDEYVLPASVVQESAIVDDTPAVELSQPVVEMPVVETPLDAAVDDALAGSPSSFLDEASAAMGLETSHQLIEDSPAVEASPDFESNAASPVQAHTHAQGAIEPGLERPTPELNVGPDPALVGGTESFTGFATRFGVENPEEVPVGIIPELMQEPGSSYEYLPPEEGHTYSGEAVTSEAPESEVPVASTPVEEAVPEIAAAPAPPEVVAKPVEEPKQAFEPEDEWLPSAAELASMSTPSAQPEPEIAAVPMEPEAPSPVETAPEPLPSPLFTPAMAARESVVEEFKIPQPSFEEPGRRFDPDATQAIPEEYFIAAEPQLETTADLAGVSIPPTVAEPEIIAVEPAPAEKVEAQAPSAHFSPTLSSIATEPSILSVGPEPPSVADEPVSSPFVDHEGTVRMSPLEQAVAAAEATMVQAAVTEHLSQNKDVQAIHATASAAEPAAGDQTQDLIARVVSRVLERMKPTLVDEIARELSSKKHKTQFEE